MDSQRPRRPEPRAEEIGRVVFVCIEWRTYPLLRRLYVDKMPTVEIVPQQEFGNEKESALSQVSGTGNCSFCPRADHSR